MTASYRDYADGLVAGIARSLSMPALLPGTYRNPFNILTDFDQWFEFERRTKYVGIDSRRVIAGMLSHDLTRAAKCLDTNYTGFQWQIRFNFGIVLSDQRRIDTGRS